MEPDSESGDVLEKNYFQKMSIKKKTKKNSNFILLKKKGYLLARIHQKTTTLVVSNSLKECRSRFGEDPWI